MMMSVMTYGVGDFYLTAKPVNDSFTKSYHVRRYWDRTPSLSCAQGFKMVALPQMIPSHPILLRSSAADKFRNLLRHIYLSSSVLQSKRLQ